MLLRFSYRMIRNLWSPFRQFLSVLTPNAVTDQMNALLKQTLLTFTCERRDFQRNLDVLQSLLDKTTAEDVGFYSKFMDRAVWAKPNKAPVTYVDIYEDETASMGIFILKPGMVLPLHNHPCMHGLLKVVAGTIKVKTFTINSTDNNCLNNKLDLNPIVLTATRHEDITADKHSKCCVLGPESSNIHEIESVGGPAAFLDILSPPYNTYIENNGPRKCTYFTVLEEIGPKLFRLKEVPPPGWFWSDCYPYTGPKLERLNA